MEGIEGKDDFLTDDGWNVMTGRPSGSVVHIADANYCALLLSLVMSLGIFLIQFILITQRPSVTTNEMAASCPSRNLATSSIILYYRQIDDDWMVLFSHVKYYCLVYR